MFGRNKLPGLLDRGNPEPKNASKSCGRGWREPHFKEIKSPILMLLKFTLGFCSVFFWRSGESSGKCVLFVPKIDNKNPIPQHQWLTPLARHYSLHGWVTLMQSCQGSCNPRYLGFSRIP